MDAAAEAVVCTLREGMVKVPGIENHFVSQPIEDFNRLAVTGSDIGLYEDLTVRLDQLFVVSRLKAQ
jgi:hypothetical protein